MSNCVVLYEEMHTPYALHSPLQQNINFIYLNYILTHQYRYTGTVQKRLELAVLSSCPYSLLWAVGNYCQLPVIGTHVSAFAENKFPLFAAWIFSEIVISFITVHRRRDYTWKQVAADENCSFLSVAFEVIKNDVWFRINTREDGAGIVQLL